MSPQALQSHFLHAVEAMRENVQTYVQGLQHRAAERVQQEVQGQTRFKGGGGATG